MTSHLEAAPGMDDFFCRLRKECCEEDWLSLLDRTFTSKEHGVLPRSRSSDSSQFGLSPSSQGLLSVIATPTSNTPTLASVNLLEADVSMRTSRTLTEFLEVAPEVLDFLGHKLALGMVKQQVPTSFHSVHRRIAMLEAELDATVPEESKVIDEDWVFVDAEGSYSDMGGPQWPIRHPVDIAAAVMHSIHRSKEDSGYKSPQFEVYAKDVFDRLAVDIPWKISSLMGPVRTLSSSSRSGLWIFESNDKQLILKRIRAVEKDKLLEIAEEYVSHTINQPNNLLCHIYGCFRYNHNGRSLYFLLMPHCCPPGATVRALYDLKGSTTDRSICGPEGSGRAMNDSFNSSTAVADGAPSLGCKLAMKDNDLKQPIMLASEADWERLKVALDRDSHFLMQNDLYDYSLLVAVADGTSEPATLQASESPDGATDTSSSCQPAVDRRASIAYALQQTGENLGAIFHNVLHRFQLHRNSVIAEAAEPNAAPDTEWQCWPGSDGCRVYMKIIDSMTQWSVLAVGDMLTIPKGRSLEYFVMKRFKPGCSLMPPMLYQERFVRNVMRKFTYPGQPVIDEPFSPNSGGVRASPLRNLLWGAPESFSPTPLTPLLSRIRWNSSCRSSSNPPQGTPRNDSFGSSSALCTCHSDSCGCCGRGL